MAQYSFYQIDTHSFMKEVNKFIISKSSIENAYPKYRSIKYRVALSSLQIMGKTAKDLNPQMKMQQTKKQSWRKPSSYSQHRKLKSSLTSSMIQQQESQEMKMSYLSTWDKLLTCPQKSQLLEKHQSKTDVLRVHLPSIVNFEPSKFTALDPLLLPIQDIQRGIQELNAALPTPKKEMEQIHSGMISFQAKIMGELEQTQKHGMRELKRLRNLLKADSVQYQAQQMRLKRQCASVINEYQQYKSNFQSTKPRLDSLQEEIFSVRPFNLERNQEFQQQFPQKYF